MSRDSRFGEKAWRFRHISSLCLSHIHQRPTDQRPSQRSRHGYGGKKQIFSKIDSIYHSSYFGLLFWSDFKNWTHNLSSVVMFNLNNYTKSIQLTNLNVAHEKKKKKRKAQIILSVTNWEITQRWVILWRK